MWDDEFKANAGEVTGSISGKCEDGVKRTATFEVAPAGDIKNNGLWEKAAKAGGSLDESFKGEDGLTRKKALKEVGGKHFKSAVSKLFGAVKKDKKEEEEADAGEVNRIAPELNGKK